MDIHTKCIGPQYDFLSLLQIDITEFLCGLQGTIQYHTLFAVSDIVLSHGQNKSNNAANPIKDNNIAQQLLYGLMIINSNMRFGLLNWAETIMKSELKGFNSVRGYKQPQ